MSSTPRLAYVQARIQSRYAMRPHASLWASLAQVQGVGHYIQQAGGAGLGSWLENLGENSSAHAVEIALRERFRQIAAEVGGWLPAQWRSAVQWFALLVDLEPIRMILGEGTSPDWFRDDPFLGQLVSDPEAWPAAQLAVPRDNGQPLEVLWRKRWRDRCPALAPRESRGLAALESLLPLTAYDRAAVARLERSFRQFSGTPVAAFSFLGLIHSDLTRLRGELLRRIEFPGGGI